MEGFTRFERRYLRRVVRDVRDRSWLARMCAGLVLIVLPVLIVGSIWVGVGEYQNYAKQAEALGGERLAPRLEREDRGPTHEEWQMTRAGDRMMHRFVFAVLLFMGYIYALYQRWTERVLYKLIEKRAPDLIDEER